jgi:hypothetical protein
MIKDYYRSQIAPATATFYLAPFTNRATTTCRHRLCAQRLPTKANIEFLVLHVSSTITLTLYHFIERYICDRLGY